MNKKIICIFLLVTLLCCFACGDMEVILDIELTELPEKLDYIVNVDNSINLSGGKIRLVTGEETIFGIVENGKTFPRSLKEYINNNIKYINSFDQINEKYYCCAVTNIDFSKVGNYSVRIYQYPDKYAEYNIKVIESKEE